LSYENAQDVIDGKILGGVAVTPEHEASDIAHDIKILNDLAKQLRERRLHSGAISGDSFTLTFTLDENGMPADCGDEARSEAHNLIEEVYIYNFAV
jgi:protein SSD1